MKPADIDLDTALRLLALPRELGRHPETRETIVAGIGRFGAYIKHGTTFKSLTPDDDVLTIGLNRAVVPARRTGSGSDGADRSSCVSSASIPMAAESACYRGALWPLCQP